MTSRRDNLRASELIANDHQPTCPHCAELNATDATVCLECGTHLTRQRKMKRRMPGLCYFCGCTISASVLTCVAHVGLTRNDPNLESSGAVIRSTPHTAPDSTPRITP